MTRPKYQALAAGSEFAGYRIEALAGAGSMGEVYRATDLSTERVVALKLIRPSFDDDAVFRERFRREGEMARSIDHPNVVRLYATDESDGRLYIAMYFVDGPNLADIVQRSGPLEPLRAARIFEQIAAGLDAVHARGLVHRDPKAGNVLIEQQGDHQHAYLSDFGLARDPNAKPLTLPGQAMGSFVYLSPEMIRADEVTPASDIYVLGCAFFECVTGKAPYSAAEGMRILWAHLLDPPESLREWIPELPATIDPVVSRAMAKDPADRYPSAGAFAAAVVEALTA